MGSVKLTLQKRSCSPAGMVLICCAGARLTGFARDCCDLQLTMRCCRQGCSAALQRHAVVAPPCRSFCSCLWITARLCVACVRQLALLPSPQRQPVSLGMPRWPPAGTLCQMPWLLPPRPRLPLPKTGAASPAACGHADAPPAACQGAGALTESPVKGSAELKPRLDRALAAATRPLGTSLPRTWC